MSAFAVGEIAILQHCISGTFNGEECCIQELPAESRPVYGPWPSGTGRSVWRQVSAGNYLIEHRNRIWQTPPHTLRKRPQPGERQELGSWDLLPPMPWRKKRTIGMPG